MAKMRIYKFWNESGTEKEKESMSLKKAVMSVQGDFKDEVIQYALGDFYKQNPFMEEGK